MFPPTPTITEDREGVIQGWKVHFSSSTNPPESTDEDFFAKASLKAGISRMAEIVTTGGEEVWEQQQWIIIQLGSITKS